MRINTFRMSHMFRPSLFRILTFIFLTSAIMFTGTQAFAAWKPDKAVTIVVPTRAGGGLDRVARILRKILLEEHLIEKITLVNKPGGGHTKALAYLSKKKGDAHYIQLEAPTMLGKHFVGKSPYGVDSVTTLAKLVEEFVCMAVPMDSKFKSAMEIVKILKKDPGGVTIGFSSAPGSAQHIGIAMPLKEFGIDITKLRTVIYGSGGKTAIAVMGGHVDVGISGHTNFEKRMEAGTLRVLAHTGSNRLGGVLKDVPTWKELGANIEFGNARFIVAPLGLNKDQIAYWDGIFSKTVKTKGWKQAVKNFRYQEDYMNSADATATFKKLSDRVKNIFKDLGLLKLK